jgi:hypothetical protein
MIPKKLHLFWAGEPMSYLHTLTVDSFHKYNPDWQIILYLTGPKDSLKTIIDSPAYTGTDHYFRLLTYDYLKVKEIDLAEYDVPAGLNGAQVSDIVAYTVLHREGGVYCDFDVLWLRPWSDMAKCDCIGDPGNYQAIVSFSELTHGWHSVGVLASEPGSDWMWNVTQLQLSAMPPFYYESFGSRMLNNHFPNLTKIMERFDRILAVTYPTFYPYHIYGLNKLFKETDLSPLTDKVVCMHWFNGHPLAKEYINGGDYPDCSMTEILRRDGYI